MVSEIEIELAGRKLQPVLATASVAANGFPAMAAIDGDPATGWGMDAYGYTNPYLVLRFAEEVTTQADSTIVVRIRQESTYRRATLGQFRLALSTGDFAVPPVERKETASSDRRGGLPAPVVAALQIAEDERTAVQAKAVREYFDAFTPHLVPLRIELAKLEAERSIVDAAIPRVVVSEATEPRETRILPRSNWMDEIGRHRRARHPRAFRQARHRRPPRHPPRLGQLADVGRESVDSPSRRQSHLAAILRRGHREGARGRRAPKAAGHRTPNCSTGWRRNSRNRRWHAEGAQPWDVKHLIRTIVTSHTYRQSSRRTPQLDERDPDNLLLARQSRFRVDAENVRDVAMQVSGLLVERFGGPSVKPYQPDGYLATLNFPKREYSASHGEDLYRRGVYTHWQRTFLQPSMATFDAPTREECTLNRINSNTPLQALVLLNDPIYVEAARIFGETIVRDGGPTLAERLSWAFERAAGRLPTLEERLVLAGLYRKNLARFQAHPSEAEKLLHVGEAPVPKSNPAQVAAMSTVARVILNLHEVITRD